MIDPKLLQILVCPLCKGPLVHVRERDELWCADSGLAYAIKDDVPVMVIDDARELTAAELASMR